MKYLVAVTSSFGGGVLVGGAFAAFITLIKIFPRLIQFTSTHKYLKSYENIFILSTIIFTRIYFSEFSIDVGDISIIIIGLFFGTYLGIFSSALAETFNVLPNISKKFKIKKKIDIVLISLGIGKICGALYYFVFKIGG